MSSLIALPTAVHEKESDFQNDVVAVIPDEEKDKEVRILDDLVDDESGWFRWIRWRPVSENILRECEKAIWSSTITSTDYSSYFVNIGPVVGEEDCKIWTVSLNPQSSEVPLVLIHGFAAGVGFWCLNLESLAAERPVYAIDLLGFGRSSRPVFSNDPHDAERQFVESIEAWRRAMKLEKIVLLGHSLGAFLSASFSISYPDVVEHLILADPWGFKDRPLEMKRKDGTEISFIIKFLVRVLEPMYPLTTIRVVGPFGPNLIRFFRSDIITRFKPYVKDAHTTVANYLYQCNAKNPSGEVAFHTMMSTFFWAKNPMHHRFDQFSEDLPITLIFGARSWVEEFDAEKVREGRGGGYVKSYVIDASHHVYADQKDEFNKIVEEACQKLKHQT